MNPPRLKSRVLLHEVSSPQNQLMDSRPVIVFGTHNR